ncbi:MAG: hypothetical protein ACI9C1_002571 [Candidatus Aldehydirespiratoraceae bacterium]|jgi:hypothetical protein
MALTMGFATSGDEVEAIQSLRYDVYVEEMGRYQGIADHENRLFREPEDGYSTLAYARDGERYIAAARLTWGGTPEGFSARQIDQYRLTPFIEELPGNFMAVGERAMVRPEARGTMVLQDLIAYSKEELKPLGVAAVFSACEPHLLSLYIGQGQQPYADRNINSPEAGYLVPLVNLEYGVDPFLERGALPTCIQNIAESRGGAVTALSLTAPEDYLAIVEAALAAAEQHRVSAFDGFTQEETDRCLARSNVIQCDAGDRVLKTGGAARNVFVVLDGLLEARAADGAVVGVISPGDAFGETAFLLEQPRSLDVFAATDGARVLSLSEKTLRTMIEEDATVAAKFLLNLSKMLCYRLVLAQ